MRHDPSLVALLAAVGISEEQVAGLVPTRRSLYQRLYVNSSNGLTAKQDYELFHAGIGDLRSKLNGSSSNNIDRTDTNMLADGELPDGEVFVALGIGVRFPYDVALPDILALEQAEVRVAKRGGKDGLVLGQIGEMPQIHGVDFHLGFAGPTETTDGTIVRDRPRFGGPPYMGKTPLFALIGGTPDSKKYGFKINSPSAVSPSGTVNPEFRLYGVWFQKPNDG